MNKRKIHHYLTVLRRLKTWQMIVIALLLTAISVALLRQNSIQAVYLFEQVKQADREGKGTIEALTRLQRHVSQHMNTHLDRVTLEETYKRDYQAALEKLANSGSTNDVNYENAQAVCQAELNRTGSFPAYAQCVSNRVGQAAPGENPQLRAALPNPERYEYSFISPAWSFDMAGFSVLLTGVLWLGIALKVGTQLLFAWIVRRRHFS